MSAVVDVPVAPRRRVGSRKLIIGGVIALGLIAYGVHWWVDGRFVQETDDAYVGGDVTVVGSKVSGYVEKVLVADNQAVHKGDLLIQIDARDYRAAVARAEAAVAAQEAGLRNLDATTGLQRSVIAEAKAGVSGAQAESTRAKLDDARYAELSGHAAVSVESAQRARATFQTAEAASDKARAVEAAARSQLEVIDTQRGQVQAALVQARAELDIARLNLSYTELRAPVDGTIGNRRARVGIFASAGSPMVSVVPAHGLWVDANFKEDQLARMTVGQAVEVRADVMPGRHFHGHLASVAPATGSQFSILPPENATGNFTKIVQRVPIRVVLDGTDGDLGVLRPGLSVTATVDTRQ